MLTGWKWGATLLVERRPKWDFLDLVVSLVQEWSLHRWILRDLRPRRLQRTSLPMAGSRYLHHRLRLPKGKTLHVRGSSALRLRAAILASKYGSEGFHVNEVVRRRC